MFQAPRGTQDILPEAAPRWRWVEETARRRAQLHGYEEIRTPTFEDVGLFLRGVGEETDIIQKEIYAFEDKGGDRLALIPEGTASIVRAYLQNGMFNRPQPIKLYSFLKAFRYDRPQAGRYREFHQFDCEVIGETDPVVDADLIALLWRFYQDLGLRELSLQINSIGDPTCRPRFVETLVDYYRTRIDELCADDRRRLETNPLRLLDCKQPRCQPIIEAAPRTVDFLCGPCADHFAGLRSFLEAEALSYQVNPRLVRGLDYYTRTVFEVWPPDVGSQSTIGGGGRYDGLAEQLGGRPTPGVGFATGLERILLNLEKQGVGPAEVERPLVYLAPLGAAAKAAMVPLANELREQGVAAIVSSGERSLKSMLRHANTLDARWAVVLGDRELADGKVIVRELGLGEQRTTSLGRLAAELVDGTKA